MERQPGVGGSSAGDGERFAWHPRYRGKTLEEVRQEVREELARDQRVYALVLEGADRDENAVLATVVALEKKWGVFDLDWAEADADELAGRIAAFERERDGRREMMPYAPPRPMAEPSRSAGGRVDRGGGAEATGPWRPSVPVLVVAVLIALVIVLSLVLSAVNGSVGPVP